MSILPLMDRGVLEAALVGLEQKRAEVEELLVEVRKQLRAPGAGDGVSSAAPARKKRTMSAAVRKRIGDATRRRWAAYRKAKKTGK
jgi:hypothetical protein